MKKIICVLVALVGMALTLNSQIPTTGLVASYPFNGNANDLSGNGNNGTVYEATLTTDRFGIANSAYNFDGVNDYVEVSPSSTINTATMNSISASLWANVQKMTDANIIFNFSNKTDNINFGANVSLDKKFNFGMYSNGALGSPWVENTDTIFLNNWYHIVTTLDFVNKISCLYVNGVLVSSDTGTIANRPNNPFLRIGRIVLWNTWPTFNGKLDDMRVYNRVLTASEITSLYNEPAPVTDVDGNTYNTLSIGTQTWMKENLKTTKYRNGDAIPNVTDATAWSNLTTGAYSDYDNTPSNSSTYGRLYNFYAVADTRNICPSGWHVPSDGEWKTLEMYLGMTQTDADLEGWRGNDQGTQLKNTTGWNSGNGNNSSGFSGLAGGFRNGIDGTYGYVGDLGYWWSSTSITINDAFRRNVYSGNGGIDRGNALNPQGSSVRCLKDTEKSISIGDATVNEGQPVEVPIAVTDLTSTDNIISYQFDVNFDNTVLTYTGNSVVGTLAAGGTVDVNTNLAGKLSIGYINDTAIVGAGNILKLQFNTLKADTTVLTISNAYLNANAVSNLNNGRVIVKDVTPPTGAITYNDPDVRYADALTITATFNEPMLSGNDIKLSLSGAATLTDAVMTPQSAIVYTYTYSVPKADGIVTISLTNGTDIWLNPVVATPTNGSTFTIVKMSYGDIDDDGKILAYDAALTLQRSVGLDPLPAVDPIPWEKWRDSTANVDAVGGVTANDASMILQYSIGKINTFTAQSKKSYESINVSDVTVAVVDKDIVFYSSGDLFGLNISATNTNQILGTPTVTAPDFLSAFNISGTTYKIGVCTANSPTDGIALLKIPYNKNGSVTFDMIVNTVSKTVTVDLVTGILEFSDDNICIYPNPVRDNLKISGLNSPTIARIYNTNGKLLLTSKFNSAAGEINVTSLSVGVYVIKFQTDKEIAVKRFTVK
jgi:uncharacterized protein (TIGR02145 family)